MLDYFLAGCNNRTPGKDNKQEIMGLLVSFRGAAVFPLVVSLYAKITNCRLLLHINHTDMRVYQSSQTLWKKANKHISPKCLMLCCAKQSVASCVLFS